ncbi:MAG: hypothetical protein ACREPM_04970 [Gemmatimonadaceae bacterium]
MGSRRALSGNLSTIGLGIALVLGAAASAQAQQRQLFQWSGRVDQEIQLTLSGRNLTTTNIGPAEPGSRAANVITAVPRMDGEVTVNLLDGRGDAVVTQQPTAGNGYTTIINVRDPQGGSGTYRLNAYWQPASGGEVGTPMERGRAFDRNRTALIWSGDVDDNLEILLQPSGISYRTIRGAEPRGVQSAINRIPSEPVQLDVSQTAGRGQVVVTQQPTAENGYTARIRVRDPQPGFGHYAFTIAWH